MISYRIKNRQKKAPQEAGLDSVFGTGLTAFRVGTNSSSFSLYRQPFSVPAGRIIRQQPGKTHYWGIPTQCSGRRNLEAAGSGAAQAVSVARLCDATGSSELLEAQPSISMPGMGGCASSKLNRLLKAQN